MEPQTVKINQSYSFWHSDIKGIDALVELALDIRWSWNHATDELWQQLDPALWELTHNPWIVLKTVSRDQVKLQLADPVFLDKINAFIHLKELAASSTTWFQKTHPDTLLTCVAYFSMEFMLSEALPIYVGGLGNVAGDQLKSASDLGVPVVAVGLLYQQGYFRQEIDKNGMQQALFPYNDPGQLPITPLRLPNGEWLRLKILLSGYPVWLRTWKVQVGNVKLYLLDSNDASNLPVHRGITSELYGGGPELRIQQEIILGIGGWKLLRALGIKPEVCHMNEGHAAFLVLERANDFRKEAGISFSAALAVTRAGNLFTTHTAVAAGFDHFSPTLIAQFLGAYSKDELGIDFNDLMALGRENPFNHSAYFNMAYLTINGSGAVNGVSSLHGEVSRQLFECLFPRWPKQEVPVGHITNGVHMPSWDAVASDKMWTEACGKERWRGDLQTLENISKVPDEALWQMRATCRNNLVNYTRGRLKTQLSISGNPSQTVEIVKQAFDPDTLTLCFARRFVPYKRPNLLLQDPERFIRLLTNTERPVQLIIAGKAPPFDEPGKALIQQWIQFIHQNNLYNHIAFLSDYDVLLAEQLVQGADVWINTPRRPWEACGTSGMKVLVNGGINVSELDGWWAEAFTPEVGWALGDELEHGDDPDWDRKEAEALYNILEKEVIPEFYTRNDKGIPTQWIQRMRSSMAILTPRFSANRTVREYTEAYYLPAAKSYLQRAAEKGSTGTRIDAVHNDLKNKWKDIKFGEVQMENIDKGYLFHVPIQLNGISPDLLLMELYADGLNGDTPVKIKMEPDLNSGNKGENIFHVQFTSSRQASDFTARIIPVYEGISVPLEDNLILWQR